MDRDQAIKLAESKFWETMSHKEIAIFQMFQPLLCIPFGVFHEAVEKTLNRPVYTHEFANVDGLKQELLGGKQAPTMEEIINMIPEEKRILMMV